MSYEETCEFLELLRPKGFHLDLGPISEGCSSIGQPQNDYPSIHIGGTNGKGSTAAFMTEILMKSGYRVGLYTSPHLVNVRERIQINRKEISEDDFSNVIGMIRNSLMDERSLSFFEMLTLAAFVHFRESKVDIAVLETGLGGRLDATNVVIPKVSIITPISFDHTEHLGRTLSEIAREKAGIIKRGVPTVTAYQPAEVMSVIKNACDDIGSPLCTASPDDIKGELGLKGEHQRQNASCAVQAADILVEYGFHIDKVEKALAETSWPGRLEVVSQSPMVILDGAHNVAGAESLACFVRSSVPKKKAVLMLGVLGDKDFPGLVRPLAPLFGRIICVRAPSERAASPKDLAAAARSSGADISIEDGVVDALKKTMKKLGKDETLIVSGSLTVVGEAKAFFNRVS